MALPVTPPLAPMLARLARELPEEHGYSFAPKWDGFRALAFRDGDDIEIRSRNQRPLARYFPEIVRALRSLTTKRFVVDGELVVAPDGVDFRGVDDAPASFCDARRAPGGGDTGDVHGVRPPRARRRRHARPAVRGPARRARTSRFSRTRGSAARCSTITHASRGGSCRTCAGGRSRCDASRKGSTTWRRCCGSRTPIEFHPLLACGDDVQQPSFVVFDLDPGAPAGLRECCEVALLVREMLTAVGLVAHAKVSGGKGLPLYVPLRRGHTYAQTKPFARTIAQVLAAERPALVVDRMDKRLRPGRVLVDWSQNDPTKSTIVVYSLRAQPAPTVSMPVSWDDVAVAASGADPDRRLRVPPADALDRLDRDGDAFAVTLHGDQALPGADLGSEHS